MNQIKGVKQTSPTFFFPAHLILLCVCFLSNYFVFVASWIIQSTFGNTYCCFSVCKYFLLINFAGKSNGIMSAFFQRQDLTDYHFWQEKFVRNYMETAFIHFFSFENCVIYLLDITARVLLKAIQTYLKFKWRRYSILINAKKELLDKRAEAIYTAAEFITN